MSARKIVGAVLAASLVLVFVPSALTAQDRLPEDNGIFTYYTPPRSRPSDSHPLRLAAYIVHPVGWLAREVVTRPLNYLVSSTRVTRSVFGYREPYDYRRPECFSADPSIPDCRSIVPYNYDAIDVEEVAAPVETTAIIQRDVYFPDVNFDFDNRSLTDLGKGRARQVARLLEDSPSLNVVLEGHADFIGSETYNEKLGMDRAEALRQELVALGVSADRVSTVTFGKSKPALTDETDWARAVNRRVEIHPETGVEAVAALE